MATPAAHSPPRPVPTRDAAWVVSPHDLVAQAVAAALRSSGAPVEFHAWEELPLDTEEALATSPAAHVLVIFDGVDRPEVVAEVSRFVALGRARVAVVTSAPHALVWGSLLQGNAVDVVTLTPSVGQLAEMVERFVAGETLMEPERRKALRADWLAALDKRHRLVAQMRGLSRQQLRVLELLASGRRVPEVAEVMGIADGTVRSHVKTLRSKLGARTQLEAVAMLRQVHEVPDVVELPETHTITDPAAAVAERPGLVPRPRSARTGAIGGLGAPIGSGA